MKESLSEYYEKIVKEYTNGEITVVWKPGLCIHSAICYSELIEVFDPGSRPWVNMNGASTKRIIEQVDDCPTQALSYYRNSDKKNISESPETMEEPLTKIKVTAMPNGPLAIRGDFEITDAKGNIIHKKGNIAFCLCGRSKDKPFCDGTHDEINFKE